MVVAINLQEHSTSIAFVSNEEFRNNPFFVRTKFWKGGKNNQEAPTSLLIESDGKTLRSFGYEAEAEYKNLQESGEHSTFFFVRGLTNLLNLEEGFDQCAKTGDETGKQLVAFDILVMIVNYLSKELTRDFEKELDEVLSLQWVLTLPNRTQEAFLKRMREASVKVGIEESKLKVLSGTDALAFYFAYLLDNWEQHEDVTFNKKKVVSSTDEIKFLTLNLEEEFLEAKLQGINTDGSIQEHSYLQRVEYGDIVYQRFEKMLIHFLGYDVQICQHECKTEWADFKNDLENKIRSFSKNDNKPVRIRLPLSLRELKSVEGVSALIDIKIHGDKLEIPSNTFEGICQEYVRAVSLFMQAFVKNEDLNITSISLVGKRAESACLQTLIAKEMAGFKGNVAVPPNASSAILVGTTIAGFSKRNIQKIATGTFPSNAWITASVDFGTTYSGVSWTMMDDFKRDPLSCYTQTWTTTTGKMNDKTPTVVLIRPDGKTIEAFGYKAEAEYLDLVNVNKHQSFYFFRNFKMMLHRNAEKGIKRETFLTDVSGRTLPAIDVFAISIKYLKDCLLGEQNKRIHGFVFRGEIRWIITVPAIWTDAAKQFMVEAAVKAGIPRYQLSLALEPEAASIFARQSDIQKSVDQTSGGLSKLSPGTKYLILDAGGGTVDIAIHEVIDEKSVREICAASGGGWGGNTVNDAFETLIKNLVGEDVYELFCENNLDDSLDFLQDFEFKKRTVTPTDFKQIRIPFPSALETHFKNHKNNTKKQTLSDHIKTSSYASGIKLTNGKLFISTDILKKLFEESTKHIISHVECLLKDIKVDAILMVGGYSDSAVLQDVVKNKYPDTPVVIPSGAVNAIMKGALIFGFEPRQISERVLKYTYGIKVCRNFVNGSDPESKRYLTDAGVKCKDVFSKHVEINQSVKLGEAPVEKEYTPLFRNQTQLSLDVFASHLKDPSYTDKDCRYLGKLTVDLVDYDGNLDRPVLVSMIFTDTEITVQAKDLKVGKKTNATIDFLEKQSQ